MSGVNSALYYALLVVHILSIVAIFGPALVFPSLARKAIDLKGESGASVMKIAQFANGPIALGGLVALVLAGIGLVVVSDGAWGFDEPWISAGFAIALALFGVGWFMTQPAITKLRAALSESASDEKLRTLRSQLAMSTGFMHLAMAVAVVLMVWKP